MVLYRQSISVPAPPEAVFEGIVHFLTNTDTYRTWHRAHLDLRWIIGEPLLEGSVFLTEEHLSGKQSCFKWIITEVVPGRVIKYRPLVFPSLFFPNLSLRIETDDADGSIFTIMGTLQFPRWIYKIFGKKLQNKIDMIQTHMEIKGEHIHQLFEFEEETHELMAVNY